MAQMTKSDVSIIGCGVAGTFAALKIAEKYKHVKCTVFEIGRKWMKRRRQLEGFLGCFPTGNGRLMPSNISTLPPALDGRTVRMTQINVNNILNRAFEAPLISDSKISDKLTNFFTDKKYSIQYNDYYQWNPEHVHKFSRMCAEVFEQTNNITFKFDEIVDDIEPVSNYYKIITRTGEHHTKKIILAVGRSGWRWASELFEKLHLTIVENYAQYGVRIDLPTCYLSQFNNSQCKISNDEFSIGPLEWGGTIIPEDHADLVISAFRSNEDRWKSDKVSFPALMKSKLPNAEADRLGKLTFLLFNDRIGKERLNTFMRRKSILSLLPEYNDFYQYMEMLNSAIPDLISCANIHVPTICPMPVRVNIKKNLELDQKNIFVAGECANVTGIYGAAVSGSLAANFACK